MKIYLFVVILSIVQVDLRRHNNSHENNKGFLQDLLNEDSLSPTFQREKKYSSRKKTLDDIDEIEKPLRRTHSSKTSNHSNHIVLPTTTTITPEENYLEQASLCINEFDVKTEQLVKVKELKNGAHMIRFVRIEEPSSSHGLDIKDICMLNCCVEKYCDLAMLSEQRTNVSSICLFIFSNNFLFNQGWI
jgi:hypothetical protein